MQAKLGQILSRVLVPCWVLTGAIYKLQETSPRLLPKETILTLADKAGIGLYLLLAVLIGLEFLAVAVMLCVSRLARPMAIFVLSVFCLILIGEMARGNFDSCGCLGAVSPPPWLMLAIDASLLAAVIVFNPSPLIPARPPRWPLWLAMVLAIAGFTVSFAKVLPAGKAMEPQPHPQPQPASNVNAGSGTPNGTQVPVTTNPNPTPNLVKVPGYWFSSNVGVWVGKPWTEVDLFKYLNLKSIDLDTGTHYVVFYSRTCDHCEDMFINDLIDPTLASKVIAVEVPDSKTLLTSPNAWAMPMTDCTMLSLPLGCDWIMTTPLALRIKDGIVECATEGEHRKCLELE